MINIEIPKPDITLIKQKHNGKGPNLSSIYGFTDYKLIPRDTAGVYMFFNDKDELLYCGQTKWLRRRIRRHFHGMSSPMNGHLEEVHKIEVCFVPNPLNREIYETYIINTMEAKYNVDKVFFR